MHTDMANLRSPALNHIQPKKGIPCESEFCAVGITSWLAKGLYIEPSVSLGLTGPGNSVAFGVTVPYTF